MAQRVAIAGFGAIGAVVAQHLDRGIDGLALAAVSARDIGRAEAVVAGDGVNTYAVLDLGSTNGTLLNENPSPLPAGVETPLADGDVIRVGAWTTVTVRRRGQ